MALNSVASALAVRLTRTRAKARMGFSDAQVDIWPPPFMSKKRQCTPRPARASAPRGSPPGFRARRVDLAGDHHLGGFDDGERIISTSQLQLVQRISRDHGCQRLPADPETHLAQQSVNPDF